MYYLKSIFKRIQQWLNRLQETSCDFRRRLFGQTLEKYLTLLFFTFSQQHTGNGILTLYNAVGTLLLISAQIKLFLS